jgi:two-component system, OmpR family, sensor histidine kinase ResE
MDKEKNVDKERILVVDDDPDVLFMIVVSLRQRGYEVEEATNGLEAMDKLREQEQFSVMLTDLMMPGMNGLALLKESHKFDPLLEVVMVTAVGTLETAIAALREDGAFDYILKPFESLNQLAVVVERALGHRRLVLEQLALQARIQSEAEWLRALISNTGDAILAADATGTLTISNPAALRFLKADNILGKSVQEGLPVALSKIINNWQVVGRHIPAILETTWSDGTILLVNLTPVMGKEGSWQGWVMVLSDVTHLKRLDELRTKMLADSARKIQLPLAEAVNDLIELSDIAAQEPRISSIVYRLTKVWDRIQNWLDSLLAQSQIGSKPEVKLEFVDIKKLLEETHQSLRANLQRDSGIKLNLQIDSDLATVRADIGQLRQMLHEMIKRAAQRSQEGAEIHLHAYKQAGQVWIEVKDSGPAVSLTDLAHIFEKSFVGTKTGAADAGFGLAMVKIIMDQMGGQVWVSGQEPVGSVISICLPIA